LTVTELRKHAALAARLRKQAGLKARLLDTVSSPKKMLGAAATTAGLVGAYHMGRSKTAPMHEDVQRAMLGMGPKSSTRYASAMTTEELLKLSAEAEPEKMRKTAACLALIEKLDPEGVPEVLGDFQKIAENVSSHMEKLGTWQDTAKRIAGGIGTAAAISVGAGVATAAAVDVLARARRGLTSATKYKAMLAANPELEHGDKATDETRAKLRPAFKTIQRFAPDIAAAPEVAGALVYRLVNSPVGDADRVLRDALALQKEHVQSKWRLDGAMPKFDLYSPYHSEKGRRTAQAEIPLSGSANETGKK